MNNIYFKFLFILASLCTNIFCMAGDSETLLLKFENRCVNTTVIDQVVCDDILGEMEGVMSENGVDENALPLMTTCDRAVSPDSSIEIAEILGGDLTNAASKMECTEEDIIEVAKVCHYDMMCNLARSVSTAVDTVAPRFIASRIRDGMSKTLENVPGSGQCMGEDESDCLTEVVTSFITNIVGTYNTLKDVASLAVKSIWGLKDYLFKKSDDLHTAANSTRGAISKFIENPWEYIKDKYMSMKSAVDTWLKKEVFCQKWEGVPHVSQCLEPLKEYDCLNCNDGMNAFCAGAGIFASEAAIAVTTAGTLTAANIAMKAGLRLGVTATTKAAARISAKVPALRKASDNVGDSKRGRGIASQAITVSMTTLKKMAEAMRVYRQKIGDSAVTRNLTVAWQKVDGALEVATKPLSFFDDMAEKAMKNVVNKGAARTGSDRLSHFVRAASRYERARIYDLVRNGRRLSNSSKRLVTARVVRRTGVNGNGHIPNGRNTGTTTDGVTGTNGGTGSDNRYNRDDSSGMDREGQHRRADDQRRIEEQRRADTQKKEAQRREEQRREEQRREEKRRAEEQRKEEENEDSENSNLANTPSGIIRATRYGVAADLAAKVNRGFRESGIKANELISDVTAQSVLNENAENSQQASNSLMDRQVIEQRSGQTFSNDNEAQNFAQAMNNQYSKKGNQSQIINDFMSEGYSYENAQKLYESEKDFYQQKYLNEQQSSIARAFRGVNGPKNTAATSSRPEVNQANQIVSDIRSQIDLLKSSMNEDAKNSNEEKWIAPQATPTARPMGTPSSSANRTGNSGQQNNHQAPSSFGNNVSTTAVSSATQDVASEESADISARAPASVALKDSELVEDQKQNPTKEEASTLSEESEGIPSVDENRMGKVDYLDLYFKLMEDAATDIGLEFITATRSDEELTHGEVNISEYEVLNITVKNKIYKIYRHMGSGESLAFKVNGSELSHLEEFPKDLI